MENIEHSTFKAPRRIDEPGVKYYDNRQSIGVWGALVAFIGVIGGGSSLAEHSFALTTGLVLGAVAIWYVGYWLLSKSVYYISDSKAGFKDLFQAKEVRFDEIQSVNKNIGRGSCVLTFVCQTRTVTMPVDLFNEAWFLAVKAELLKRGVPVTVSAYGMAMKER